MPAVGALFALLFVLGIAGTIGLWYAIDRETDDAETMSRSDAERAARQDTDDDTAGRDGNGSDGGDAEEWGSGAEWGSDDAGDRG